MNPSLNIEPKGKNVNAKEKKQLLNHMTTKETTGESGAISQIVDIIEVNTY